MILSSGPFSVPLRRGDILRDNNIATISPEQRDRRAWHPTPNQEGFYAVEPVGAENRNTVAASASVTIAAAAASGTTQTAQLSINQNYDLPYRFLMVIQNGSDANVSVEILNSYSQGTPANCVVSGTQATVNAGQGLVQLVYGVGVCDGNPIVQVATTSAATNGGTVSVELRYI